MKLVVYSCWPESQPNHQLQQTADAAAELGRWAAQVPFESVLGIADMPVFKGLILDLRISLC